ncbi:hypothetical protein Efla_001975 [Eimeria flavescens]
MMNVCSWVYRQLRVAGRRVWRPLLRRVAGLLLLLLLCCCCVYLHVRSLPERPTPQQLLQGLLQQTAEEAFENILGCLWKARGPLLQLLEAAGGLLLHAFSLLFLCVSFLYPFIAPLVVKGVRVYVHLQPQQQLLVAAAAAAVPLWCLLRVSERLRRLRAAAASLYSRLTAWVAAGAPLALTLLLHACGCLLLGPLRLGRWLSAVWTLLPLLGSAAFAAGNLDICNACTAAAAADAEAEEVMANTPEGLSAAAATTGPASAAKTERRLRALRSLTCWLMMWFVEDLGLLLSRPLLLLPLPVSFQTAAQWAPQHLLLLYVLLGLLTGGSSSLLLFVYSHKCMQGLAALCNALTAKLFGFALLLPPQLQQQQQQQLQQQLVHVAEQQQQQLAAAAATGKMKALPSTLQLARAFRLSEGDALLLHCLPDFSPLEETLQQQQAAAAGSSKSIVHRIGAAAAAAFGRTPDSSSSSSSRSRSGMFGSLSVSAGWRLLLQQVQQRLGVALSPSVIYLLLTALRYSPQLLLLLLPSFLLSPLLLLLLRAWPLLGTLGCLARRGSVSSRLYWLCYFSGAAAAYNVHLLLTEHALLRLLPLQQTRLLLMLWAVQTAAKLVSQLAKLDPPDMPQQQQQQQQKQQQLLHSQRTLTPYSSSSRSSPKGVKP